MAGMVLPSGLVTFAFADIEGSAELAARLGRGYQVVLDRYRRLLVDVVRAHGGAMVSIERDSCLLAFRDARAALRAGRAAQQAIAGTHWPGPAGRLLVRIGMHTGQARPRGGEYASPEVHRAARVTTAAHGGQVLCTAATVASATPLPEDVGVRDLGLHRLRGFDGRERLLQVGVPGRQPRFPRPRTEPAPPHNLPAQLTPFVGRGPERARLAELVSGHRVVTVAGGSGSGKTRLAVRVAADLLPELPDGCWFADLTTVADPDGVALTLRGLLGSLLREPAWSPTPTGRRLLLVLDGADAQPRVVAPVLRRLLATCPGVRMLATGRGPVGVPGEVVWQIPPLTVPPAAVQPPATALEAGSPAGDALTLLLERMAAARGGAQAGPAELPHLHRLAVRLAGSPRAIEQAAARLRVLGAGELLARLEQPGVAFVRAGGEPLARPPAATSPDAPPVTSTSQARAGRLSGADRPVPAAR